MITYIIIGVYFLVLILVGVSSSKKNKTQEDFYVAGRSLNLWTASNTLAATAIGSGTTIGIAAMAYEEGIAAGWILVGYSLGFVLIALLIGKKIYRLNAFTLTDIIGSRFDTTTRNLTAILVLISFLGIAAAQFVALGNIVYALIGISFQNAVILCGVVVIIYTMLGGLNALATTDSYQLILNLVGVMIILPFLGFRLTNGFTGIVNTLGTGIFNLGAYGTATTLGFFSWIIPQAFLAQELWVRIFACKNEKLAVKATLLASIGIYLPYMIAVVSLGLIGATLVPGIAGDAVLPVLITELAPPVLQGFLLAGLIAAVMSCADSVLLVASSNLVHDLYKNTLGKTIKPEDEIKASRIGVIVVGVVGIGLALYSASIIGVMQMMATPFVGSLFPIVLAMFFWEDTVTSKAAKITIGTALALALIMYVGKINLFGLDPSFVTVVVCSIVLVVSSLLTKDDNKKKEV